MLRLYETFACRLIYFADLDAIQGLGDNRALLYRIAAEFPELHLWVDAGPHGPADIDAIKNHPGIHAVIGSESWQYRGDMPRDELILSIDSDEHGPRDPSGICRDPLRRPDDLILMNLTRVGSNRGPDLDLLAHWQREAPLARLTVAGGVRDSDDLRRLNGAGASGVLLASALHQGHISPADLTCFS